MRPSPTPAHERWGSHSPIGRGCAAAGLLHPVPELIPLEVFSQRIPNHLIPFHREFGAYIFQPLPPGFWIVWVQKNKEDMLFAVPVLMHKKQYPNQGIHPIYFEIHQEC